MDVSLLTLYGVLQEDLYKRRNKSKVKTALANLEVEVPNAFSEFYNTYEGPFWEEHVPIEWRVKSKLVNILCIFRRLFRLLEDL